MHDPPSAHFVMPVAASLSALHLACAKKSQAASSRERGTCWLQEVCTGDVPRRGRNRPIEVPRDCPAEVARLVKQCWSENIDERPDAKQVVRRLMQAAGTSSDRR